MAAEGPAPTLDGLESGDEQAFHIFIATDYRPIGATMHEGSPATQGNGPAQYTIRLVFQMSYFDRFELLPSSFDLASHSATIVTQDHFYALRVTGFNKSHEAEQFAQLIRGAMIELTATKGVMLWVEPLLPVDRNQFLMNVQIREFSEDAATKETLDVTLLNAFHHECAEQHERRKHRKPVR